MIGLRPYRSASFPQRIDVRALPIMNDDAKNNEVSNTNESFKIYMLKQETINFLRYYQQNQHRNQYALLF